MGERTSGTDIAAILARGALGAIPVVGPMAAEVIGVLIPGQRIDRIQALLTELAERVKGIERERIEHRFVEPGFVDLFEDGLYQAVRATSAERVGYLAALLKNGLRDEDVRAAEYKRLLSLLGELTDSDVIWLRSFCHEVQHDEAFFEHHAAVLTPRPAHMGLTQEEFDAATMQEASIVQLERLRLLAPVYRLPSRGAAPEFDTKRGTLKASGHEVTRLGDIFLRTIDLVGPQ